MNVRSWKQILEPTYGCIVYQEQVMQIVRDTGRLYAWTKRPCASCDVQEKRRLSWSKERQNFVYGNEEEGVPGCINNGIDEKTANQIYDEMIDFAKYAFNKSHAACLCGSCLSDSISEILLSGRIYGSLDDLCHWIIHKQDFRI